ncbi:MAG: 4-fold beta flower protein [Kiritimatiellia bacterium]|jgi:hypothetical protein
MTLYDKNGRPIAYADNDGSIYLFSGEPIAYLDSDSVWAYSGKHLGWFDGGLIRDNCGDTAFFTENASSGPIKPIKAIKPIKGVKKIRPIKGIKEIKPIRAINSLRWSGLSGESFFYQD